MEASQILEQAKMEQPPNGWLVLPLLRHKVALGIAGWIFGIILGFGFFTIMAFVVIPYNYQRGVAPAIITTLFLGILLFIGIGSLWSLFLDVRRLIASDQHLIVITSEDFVKQEGSKIIQVPLTEIQYVTARGKPKPDRSISRNPIAEIPKAGDNTAGFIVGRGFLPSGIRFRMRRMRTPTTLAFIDGRTDKEVIVLTDDSFGDPYTIAALLKDYAENV